MSVPEFEIAIVRCEPIRGCRPATSSGVSYWVLLAAADVIEPRPGPVSAGRLFHVRVASSQVFAAI